MENVTGWEDLVDANIVEAVYNMFDEAFGSMGFPVVALFFIYQWTLYSKTQNMFLMFVTSIFFVSLYASSMFMTQYSLQILLALLVIEFAGVLYMFIKK